jgi:phosphoglycerate dehydrogenase-like enzyme
MREVNVLTIQRISPADRERIQAVDPAIRLVDAGGWFDGEIRETWPAFTVARYLAPNSTGRATRAERDHVLADAEVILGGWPFPKDLRSRAPRLKWFHQRPAGASNLRFGDLWGSDVVVTTSRGLGSTLAIAEYTVAGIVWFAKGLHRAVVDRQNASFDFRSYRPMLLEGKTLCVIGAGGIGREVGRLAAGLGIRVIGTTRSGPAPGAAPPPGFETLGTAADLDPFLARSDFVAVCCQWTPETTNLIDGTRLTAMKPGVILANVARGEIVDETAVAEALASGHLRGVVLDVYNGEFEGPPPEDLWRDPRVLITPHVSGMSDETRHGAIDLFCENLRAWLDGRTLQNVVDWTVGY